MATKKTKDKAKGKTKTKAIVKKKAEETGIAKVSNLPDYLQDSGPADLDIEPGEISIPLVKLLQSNSPAALGESPLSKSGNFFNSASQEDLGDEVVFIPLLLIRKKILWRPMKEGGGIVCRSWDNRVGNIYGECRSCKDEDTGVLRTAWGRDSEPPVCTKYYDFLSIIFPCDVEVDDDSRIVSSDDPIDPETSLAVISMSVTKMKAAKRIIQIAQAKRAPLYANVFSMGRTFVDTGQFQYYQPTIEWVGWANQEMFQSIADSIDGIKALAKPEAYTETESPDHEERSEGGNSSEEDDDFGF